MRISTLVAGIFGIALVTAAPIDESKTPDLTTTTEGCGIVTLENRMGYGLVNDRNCYAHPERIVSFQIRPGYTCTFFEDPSCDQSKGYRGWTGPAKINFPNTNVVLHGYKCWTTPQGTAVIESPVESIAARTPTEVPTTGMGPLFHETSIAVKGCGTAMLDDGTGVGYNIVSGTCFKSAPITKFWINQGCRCTFYSEPCDMTKLYIGFGGGTHGTVAGRGMRGYSCLDHSLDAAAAPAVIAPAIEARIETHGV